MINQYRVLGLNPTGKNAEGEYYSETEIRDAYITQSRKWHSDKNPAPEATNKFQQINAANSFLKDDDKRKAFNKELAENPSLSQDENKDLFVTLSPSSLTEEKTQPVSPTQDKEFNLTHYIGNAHADIVSIASNDFNLAKAIFSNGKLLSPLSLENQYELILLIVDNATKRDEQECLANEFSKQIATYINSLKNNTPPHQDAFINACLKRVELVPSLMNSAYASMFADMADAAFYRLALESEVVVDLFMQQHSHYFDLELFKFLALKDAHPNIDILALYKEHVDQNKYQKAEAALTLLHMIKEGNIHEDLTEEQILLIKTIGLSALELTNKNNNLQTIFLKMLIESNVVNINDLSPEQLLVLYGATTSKQHAEDESLHENSTNQLIDKIEISKKEDEFKQFYRYTELANVSPELKEKMIAFILHFKRTDGEVPVLISLLNSKDNDLVAPLYRNRELFIALLNDSHYLSFVESEQNKKYLFDLLITHQLTPAEVNAQSFAVIKNYIAVLDKITDQVNALSLSDWIKENGYFHSLLVLTIEDVKIKAVILQHYLKSSDEPIRNIKEKIIENIQQVLSDPIESESLLADIPKNKTSLIVSAITKLAENNSPLLARVIENTQKNKEFFKNHVSAWIIEQLVTNKVPSPILLSSESKAKLSALEQFREELKNADNPDFSFLEQHAKLELLLKLSAEIGVDYQLLQAIEKNLMSNLILKLDLYHSLLRNYSSVLVENDIKKISKEIKIIEDKLPKERHLSYEEALRKLEDDSNMSGNELLELVRNSDPSIRKIITDKKLDGILLYAEKLDGIVQPLKNTDIHAEFSEKTDDIPINAENDVNAFWDKLNKTPLNELINQGDAFIHYANLNSQKEKTATSLRYLNSFPKNHPDNWLLWAIKLANINPGDASIKEKIAAWQANIPWNEAKPILLDLWKKTDVKLDEIDKVFGAHTDELVPILLEETSNVSKDRIHDLSIDPTFHNVINAKLQEKGSIFKWPLEDSEKKDNIVCQLVISGKLFLGDLHKLSKEELTKLNHPSIHEYLKNEIEKNPTFKIEELLNYKGDIENFPSRYAQPIPSTPPPPLVSIPSSPVNNVVPISSVQDFNVIISHMRIVLSEKALDDLPSTRNMLNNHLSSLAKMTEHKDENYFKVTLANSAKFREDWVKFKDISEDQKKHVNGLYDNFFAPIRGEKINNDEQFFLLLRFIELTDKADEYLNILAKRKFFSNVNLLPIRIKISTTSNPGRSLEQAINEEAKRYFPELFGKQSKHSPSGEIISDESNQQKSDYFTLQKIHSADDNNPKGILANGYDQDRKAYCSRLIWMQRDLNLTECLSGILTTDKQKKALTDIIDSLQSNHNVIMNGNLILDQLKDNPDFTHVDLENIKNEYRAYEARVSSNYFDKQSSLNSNLPSATIFEIAAKQIKDIQTNCPDTSNIIIFSAENTAFGAQHVRAQMIWCLALGIDVRNDTPHHFDLRKIEREKHEFIEILQGASETHHPELLELKKQFDTREFSSSHSKVYRG